MGRHKGAQYTKEEAAERIPSVARLVALGAVDLVITLDHYPLNSGELEMKLWQLTGEVGHLNKLFHTLWKADALARRKGEITALRGAPLKRH
jgi:hypothetical protein